MLLNTVIKYNWFTFRIIALPIIPEDTKNETQCRLNTDFENGLSPWVCSVQTFSGSRWK